MRCCQLPTLPKYKLLALVLASVVIGMEKASLICLILPLMRNGTGDVGLIHYFTIKLSAFKCQTFIYRHLCKNSLDESDNTNIPILLLGIKL